MQGSAEQQQKLDSRPQVIAATSKDIVSLLKERLRCSETELQEELANDSFTEPISVADWLKKYERTALFVVCSGKQDALLETRCVIGNKQDVLLGTNKMCYWERNVLLGTNRMRYWKQTRCAIGNEMRY